MAPWCDAYIVLRGVPIAPYWGGRFYCRTLYAQKVTTLYELREAALTAFGAVWKRELAVGGQKVVGLVNVDENDRVLKLMLVDASDPTVLERARREFDLLSSTPHANLVKVESGLLAVGNPVGGVAWLEEYLEGVDVSGLFGDVWSEDEVLRLGIDVSGALGALHDLGVVHRDLSAGNVRRLNSGVFKVMDPGFAKYSFRTGITVGGQPGTRGFMTPEHVQAYTSPIPPSDVFALANLMYAATTGQLPFPYLGDDTEYVTRLIKGRYEPILSQRSSFSPALAGLIEQALNSHPARRFRNGRVLHSKLLELA